MFEDKGKQPRNVRIVPLRFAIEELKFLRSTKDVYNFYRKLKLVVPRVIGTFQTFYRVPPVLQIEPTNICNASCICCPASRSSRPRGHMDFSLFRKIIDDASSIGVNAIFLFLHGEPSLHPKIVEIIRYIKMKGLYFHLVTNGISFSEKKIRGILQAGVDCGDHISFSIHGASEEVHDHIAGLKCLSRIEKNIHHFLKLRKDLNINGPVIETVHYIMPENQHETESYMRKWTGVVDHVRLSGEISQSFAQYEQDVNTPVARTKPCLNLWQKMTIGWEGNVVLCVNDVGADVVLGNLNEQTISEIWNSKKLLAIKRFHKQKQFDKIPICEYCDM